MQDITFNATLESAELTARKDPDHPATWLRRAKMTFKCEFSSELAEWLDANGLRDQLAKRVIKSVKIRIDAYHARASFSGEGNATTDIDGVSAKASVVGGEDKEHEELKLVIEAFPDAKLMTFLAASLKCQITCDLKRSQLGIAEVAQ